MHRIARLLAVVALVALGAGSARGGTPAQDLASLNALRDRNGIPAGIVLNPEWSARCAQHLAYMRRTGAIGHAEDPASPWYTDGGNWAAGHAVLAAGITWTPQHFIWEMAPLHFAQLLAPQLSEIGIADDDDFVCATTWPGYLRPAPAATAVLSYPGPGAGIYASEQSAEWPTTPAGALGLANPTGPHLYVFQWGQAVLGGVTAAGRTIKIQAASLAGPEGRVPVRWVDPTNRAVGQYLAAASGIVIPVRPLVGNASYAASVSFNNGVRYTWGFTTAADRGDATLKEIAIAPQRAARRRQCTRRRDGQCDRWRMVYVGTVSVAGRFTSAERPTVTVTGIGRGTAIRPPQRVEAAAAAADAFRARFRFVTVPRRFRLRISIAAGGGTSQYVVRFRIEDLPSGTAISIVQDILPVPVPAAAAPLRQSGALHAAAPPSRNRGQDR